MDKLRTAKPEPTEWGVSTHLRYPHRLNLYERPPLGEVSLEDFERWAIDRLKILSEIENCFVRNRSFEEIKEMIKSQSAKYLPLSANTAQERRLDDERRKDHVSHFILRLAFCRTEELRRRFVKAETTLFKARFDDEDTLSRERFLAAHGTEHAEIVDDAEKARLRSALALASNVAESVVARENYMKIPWQKVSLLVEKRRVYLSKGMAYVPAREQSSVIIQDFGHRLEKALEMTEKALPPIDEDDRIKPIVEGLGKGFLTGISSEYAFGDESAHGDAITSEMVDELSRHWPLCMRNLHDALKRDHHLKYFARLQYGLFLKGMGMSVEDAMIFWRKSFSSISEDKFRKEYAYNIKHSYGLVGGRNNYPPRNCARIVTQDTPGTGDSHGCPFAHFGAENLQLALSAHFRISAPQDINEIMTAVNAKKYHVACTRVFEITHAQQGVKKGDGLGGGESVSHPNSYAMRSRELEKEMVEARDGPKVEPKEEDAMDVS